MIELCVDEGYAMDMLSILQVKNELSPSEQSNQSYEKFKNSLISKFDEEIFYKILNSIEYKNLKQTNSDIFKSVDLAKKNLVRASFIDYLNWVRFFWKTQINIILNTKQFENKIGYDWNAVKIEDSHLVLLLDKDSIPLFKNKKIKMYNKQYPSCGNKFVHRIIVEKKMGKIDGFVVDHKNGNKYDSRISNLRICKPYQNSHNKIIQKNNTSGYVGVFLGKKNKYYSRIQIMGKVKTVGHFNSKRDAAIARDIYGKKYLGDFYQPNITDATQKEVDGVLAKIESRKPRVSSSKYYGVKRCPINHKWIAGFFFKKKRYYLGRFEKEEDAAIAVDKQLIKLNNLKKLNFNRGSNIFI